MAQKPAQEKTPASILQHDPESILAFIQNKVVQLTALNQIWQAEIANDLAEQTRVANFRDGYLIIECASAVWATRLRYSLPDITAKLSKYVELRELTHIEWKIQPQFHTPYAQLSTTPLALSSSSAQLLKNAADHIKIKPLQEALLRIAQHEK
ncbi:MAG: DciA family protein [Candidatus Aquirickettsiella sp.]